MNIFERKTKFQQDEMVEMIRYAETINKDHDSKEFADALLYWVHNYLDEFRRNWEAQFGTLEELI